MMRWVKCAAVLITVLFLSACVGHAKPEYEKQLFDTSHVHTVDVTIAEADWQNLITHPEEKTKYEADLVIDGEEVKQVSFSAKGNYSLAFVKARGDSNRYSFKINFGKNIKGQTFQGLDKLHLQNLYADRTYMKDYIAYDLFRKMGVPAPLTSYVFITVNGKDFGLYLAAEDLDDSFLDRTCRGNGSLYQPELSEQALDEEKTQALLDGGNAIVSGARGADRIEAPGSPAIGPFAPPGFRHGPHRRCRSSFHPGGWNGAQQCHTGQKTHNPQHHPHCIPRH